MTSVNGEHSSCSQDNTCNMCIFFGIFLLLPAYDAKMSRIAGSRSWTWTLNVTNNQCSVVDLHVLHWSTDQLDQLGLATSI